MKQIFSVIFLLIVSISTVLAQTNSCNLQLNVYKYQENPAIEPELIKNVSASLKNIKSQKEIKPALQNEIPYYANVPVGTYQAAVLLKDYKITTKEIELTCELADEKNSVTENLFLWKGNPKETMEMTGGVFVIADDSLSDKFQKNSTTENKTEVIDGKIPYLAQPVYPPAAKAVRARGTVQVQVTIDELGKVISAKAISGHPLLRTAAEKAARESKFFSTRLKGMPVKITGILAYNFVP